MIKIKVKGRKIKITRVKVSNSKTEEAHRNNANGHRSKSLSLIYILQTIAFLLIIAATILLPNLVSSNYTYPYEFPKFIAFLVLAAVLTNFFFLQLIFWKRKHTIQSTLINLLIFFLLGYILSSVFSTNPLLSITGFYGKWSLGLIALAAFIFTAFTISNNLKLNKNLKIVASALAISALISTAVILIPLVWQEKTFSTRNIAQLSTFGTNQTLASFLLICLPVQLGLISFLKKDNLKLILGLFVNIQLLVLIKISLMNTTWGIAIKVTLIAAVISYLLHGQVFSRVDLPIKLKKTWQGSRLVVLTIFLLVFLGLMLPTVKDRIHAPGLFENLRENLTDETNSFGNYINECKNALQVFTRKPITGTGPEMLHSIYPKYRRIFGIRNDQKIYISNFYIQLLATTGLLGFLPFILLTFLVFKKVWINSKNLNSLEFGFAISTLIFFVVIAFSSPTITTLFLGAILLGITIYTLKYHDNDNLNTSLAMKSKLELELEANKHSVKDRTEQGNHLKSDERLDAESDPDDSSINLDTNTNKILLFLNICTLAVMLISIYKLEKADRLAHEAKDTGTSPAEDVVKTKKAIQTNPNEAEYYLNHAYNLTQFLRFNPDRIDDEEIERQIRIALQTALALDNKRIDTYYRISNIYLSLHELYPQKVYHHKALNYLKTAQLVSPNSKFLKIETADLYVIADRPESALNELSQAIQLDKNFWEAYLFKANLLLETAESKQVPASLERIQYGGSQEDQSKKSEIAKEEKDGTIISDRLTESKKSNSIKQAKQLAKKVIEESDNPQYQEAAQNILLLIQMIELSESDNR
jgi:O-antigen ligase